MKDIHATTKAASTNLLGVPEALFINMGHVMSRWEKRTMESLQPQMGVPAVLVYM